MEEVFVYPQVQELRPESTTEALRKRAEGQARNGFVYLKNFDDGIAYTIGGEFDETNKSFSVTICGTNGPPGSPQAKDCCDLKIPIVFDNPEPALAKSQIPLISIKRDSLVADLSRWMPGQLEYRAPTKDARKVTVFSGKSYEKTGFDKYEQRQMGIPYNISYSVSIIGKTRHTGPYAVEPIFQYLLNILQPHHYITVQDTEGDWRTYESECYNIASTDSVVDVAERYIGFSFGITVQANLDAAPTEIWHSAFLFNTSITNL